MSNVIYLPPQEYGESRARYALRLAAYRTMRGWRNPVPIPRPVLAMVPVQRCLDLPIPPPATGRSEETA